MLAAIGYGIVHDLFTAHLCVEYFTIGHPKVIESEYPILLALTWGVIATWWVALSMGLLIVAFNHIGSSPSLEFKEIRKLITRLLIIMFSIALMAGIIGFLLAEFRVIHLMPWLGDQMDPSVHSRFLAAGWAHNFSYLSGIIGTIVLCIVIVKRRRKATSA